MRGGRVPKQRSRATDGGGFWVKYPKQLVAKNVASEANQLQKADRRAFQEQKSKTREHSQRGKSDIREYSIQLLGEERT